MVIQNSLLVLKQYTQRFKSENIDYQIITKKTEKIDKKVVLLINNSHRYRYFKRIEPTRYILMLDESDQTIRVCPLSAYKTFHITATPYNYPKKFNCHFDRIIKIDKPENYYSIDNLKVNVNNDDYSAVRQFINAKGKGMLLINRYFSISQMRQLANFLSGHQSSVPIVLLTSEKRLYLGNTVKNIKQQSISKIIDSLEQHSKIIFIANRLSNRGLSYVSSDFSRHLTHQITRVKSTVGGFIQSLRILGIYNKDTPKLVLTIMEEDQEKFKRFKQFINDFDLEN